jgi:hypothetical protein
LLQGGVTNSASDFDKDKKLTDVRMFEGVDFRKLRDANIAEEKKNKRGTYLYNLKQEWKEAMNDNGSDMGKGKRFKKSRIVNVSGIGSGYGSSSVPILAINDYDLDQGELSVWNETKKPVAMQPKEKVRPKQFVNQDFCQTCGQGGELILCPRCPVSVHSHCCGLRPANFQSCSHHRCSICEKTAHGAGGLIYPCQSCPSAFCGDCLPSKDVRFLGNNVPRFEKLGRKSNNLYYYIHCSKQCEHVAKVEFGFKDIQIKPKCPVSIDVSYAFGPNALSLKEIAKLYKDGGSSLSSLNRKSLRKSNTMKSEEILVIE